MNIFYIYTSRRIVDEKSGIKYEKHPIAAVGVEKSNDGFNAQYAICNKKDNFNKKIARRIVSGRLRTKPISLNENTQLEDLFTRNKSNALMSNDEIHWSDAIGNFKEVIKDVTNGRGTLPEVK